MIKFFRKIRQNLLSENKFNKYVIYAIGEIVLVVIGIMIALQINNWNENRKKSNTELQLYANIFKDLKSEQNSIHAHLRSAKNYDNLHKQIYNEISNKTPYDPEKFHNFLLWYHRYNMFFNEKYKDFLTTITNDKIHLRLKSYLRQENTTFNTVTEFNEHQLQQVRPYLSKYGVNSTETMFNEADDFSTLINRKKLINYSKLKEQYGSEELDQLLFSIRFKNLWMAQNFEWLQENNRKFQLILGMEMKTTKLAGSFKEIEPRSIEEFQIVDKTDNEILEIITQDMENERVYNFSEREINSFGYDLMRSEKYKDALTIFKLNIELNPSWSTYDSYGECLIEAGEIKKGVKAYEKSLELNPDNSTAKEVIESHKNEG